MAEKKKVVEIDTQQATTSVKDLRQQLKELRTTMLNTAEGTEEYNAALTQAAEITHTLKEQTEYINATAMDFGQVVSNVNGAIGGMIGGLQAAKATMNLFGVENETVIKSLQQMQNLMAISQALPAMDKGVKAFKKLSIAIKTATGATHGWKAALVSTGIGAIVVALGLLIANFDKISEWLDELTGQTDFLGTVADAVVGGLNAAWAGLVQTLKAVGTAIVTYISTPFKAVMNAINAYTSTEGSFADKLKAAGSAMKNGFVSDWKEVGNDFKQIGVVSANAYQEGFNKNRAKRMAKNQEEATEEGKAEGKAKGTAKAEAEQEAYWKKRMKQIDANERAEMLALQALGLGYEEYVNQKEVLEDKFTQKRIDALKEILATSKDLTEQEIADLESQLIDLQDKLYKKPEETKETTTTATTTDEEKTIEEKIAESLIETANILNDLSDNPAWGNILKHISDIALIFDDLNKNHIEKGSKDAYAAYARVAGAAFAAIGDMMYGLAAEQDETNKEGFEKSKKMQIAGATMQMLAGIATAISGAFTTKSGPWDIALAAIQAAMIGAVGGVQIAKIAKMKYNGSGSSGASASPNISAMTSLQAPVQYTQDVQGAAIEGAITDTKVYVTEGDITDTQKKVDVAESENRY